MRDFTEQHVSTQDYKLIFRLLKYLKPYTGRFIVALLLMIVTTFTNMILPLASGFGIDLMTDELFPGRFNLEQKVTIRSCCRCNTRLNYSNIDIFGIYLKQIITRDWSKNHSRYSC